jgi:hypothetical protein
VPPIEQRNVETGRACIYQTKSCTVPPIEQRNVETGRACIYQTKSRTAPPIQQRNVETGWPVPVPARVGIVDKKKYTASTLR